MATEEEDCRSQLVVLSVHFLGLRRKLPLGRIIHVARDGDVLRGRAIHVVEVGWFAKQRDFNNVRMEQFARFHSHTAVEALLIIP